MRSTIVIHHERLWNLSLGVLLIRFARRCRISANDLQSSTINLKSFAHLGDHVGFEV